MIQKNMKKINHSYKCKKCGKIAMYNLQNVNIVYTIDKNGKFKKHDEWEGDNNEFFCEEHNS